MKGPSATLERALSKLGAASRTRARELILAGKVTVDGRVVRDPLRRVDTDRARLELLGKRLARGATRTIMLNKPRGLVTTRSDERGRETVYSCLSGVDASLMPVGRLDLATSGLLLLTNDHQLANWLTDPKSAVVRTYLVSVRGELSDLAAERMCLGVIDQGEELRASQVKVRKRSKRETHLVVALAQGKNREIRRLCKALGHEVTKLRRVAYGGLELGTLEVGKWREVTAEELARHFPMAPRAV